MFWNGCLVVIFFLVTILRVHVIRATRSNKENDFQQGARQRRGLQNAPYFTTTTLGNRNYNITSGNPLKGLGTAQWAPGTTIDHAIEFTYVGLSDIVTDFNTYSWTSFEQKIVDTWNRKRQLVPRVYIVYPPYTPALPTTILKSVKTGQYVMSGVTAICPFFNDTVMLTVINNFIAAYAAKYDGDPRIAYLNVGLLGYWGEFHVLKDPFLPDWVKDNVTRTFKKAFKKTPTIVRYASVAARDLNIGYHDDSFTWATLDGTAEGPTGTTKSFYFWPSIVKMNHSNAWRFAPITGETRPENNQIVMNVDYPAYTVNKQDFMLCATTTHTIYMRLTDFATAYAVDKAKFTHSNMGYNYQLRQVSVAVGTVANTVDISVTIEQIGYSPFYYPLSIGLRCKGGILQQSVPGVEKLIDQFTTSVFTFKSVPVDSTCLSNVQFTLESPNIHPQRRMKWAQGTTGNVSLSIPLPSGTAPSSVIVVMPTPVAVAPVPVPTTSVVVIMPTPVAAAPVPTATVIVVSPPVPVPVAAPVPKPTTVIVISAPVPVKLPVAAPVPTPTAVIVVSAPVPVPTSPLYQLFIVNADSNTDITPISSGQSLTFAALGTINLSIRANAPSNAVKVIWSWTDASGIAKTVTESTAPWLMGGNSGTDYLPVPYFSTPGTKTFTVNFLDANGITVIAPTIQFNLS